ncbi:L,D-transpeptidase [Fluviicola chungangensis]|uniref:L,D-transpeptidase n=1 Tax=Fluviicola chungangensis TaxID=2597671 RepID=UPI00319DA0CB
MKKFVILLHLPLALLFSCQSESKASAGKAEAEKAPSGKGKTPERFAFELKDAKQWLQDSAVTASGQEIVWAVNRTDERNFKKMDTIIVPIDFSGEIASYLPFPSEVSYLKAVNKIIYFSYPTQTFAAYENGRLIRTGPTNMGREKHQTPTGLFYTNWKAKKTVSTINDEWILKWNFNILNEAGVGWHQYALPGYPASHSCLRLGEKDAKHLYYWADQWVLEDKMTIRVKGTPLLFSEATIIVPQNPGCDWSVIRMRWIFRKKRSAKSQNHFWRRFSVNRKTGRISRIQK